MRAQPKPLRAPSARSIWRTCASSRTPPAGEGVSIVKIEIADGPTATLRLRKDGDSHWLSVAATGEGDAAKKAAEEIAARTKDWEFKIPAFKAELILKKRSDLLEAPAS